VHQHYEGQPVQSYPIFLALVDFIAIAALQSPSVGCPVKFVPMQGQMKLQLQVSMY
jgi:hypothetical protein